MQDWASGLCWERLKGPNSPLASRARLPMLRFVAGLTQERNTDPLQIGATHGSVRICERCREVLPASVECEACGPRPSQPPPPAPTVPWHLRASNEELELGTPLRRAVVLGFAVGCGLVVPAALADLVWAWRSGAGFVLMKYLLAVPVATVALTVGALLVARLRARASRPRPPAPRPQSWRPPEPSFDLTSINGHLVGEHSPAALAYTLFDGEQVVARFAHATELRVQGEQQTILLPAGRIRFMGSRRFEVELDIADPDVATKLPGLSLPHDRVAEVRFEVGDRVRLCAQIASEQKGRGYRSEVRETLRVRGTAWLELLERAPAGPGATQ